VTLSGLLTRAKKSLSKAKKRKKGYGELEVVARGCPVLV
jgi:hypothetical protein